jgi:hypothetical protein
MSEISNHNLSFLYLFLHLNLLQVTGVITDAGGKARWVLQGSWDEKIEGAKVLNTIEQKGKTVYETGPTKVLWQRQYPP